MSSANRTEAAAGEVVERLRRVMTVAGFTHRELAERSGVKLSSLNAYLSGSRRLPAAAVPGLARALGVSCDYVLTGEPAALDPGILWGSLTDPRFAQGFLGGPVSEEGARALYGAYTSIYLERLSRYGRDFPCWDQARELVDAFTDKMERSTDPLIQRLRQLFPEV